MNGRGLVIDNNDLFQCRDEEIRELDMHRVGYILCYAFRALKCRLEHMSEALVQVLNAHILAPEENKKTTISKQS